ncbi:MAG TPA: hydrogenase expression/formation protein, partial [Azonexus sp.]|nr:hydrogenase expression/formation protein [Azonexus sp.]
PRHWRVQETAFAGLWRVLEVADGGRFVLDRLETGTIPSVLTEAMLQTAAGELPAPDYPAGCMNAQALVEEIRLQAAAWQPGTAAHVINLTLLPVSDADLDTLYGWLGHREVSILSRGYGNCRITSTRLRNVWWVQYFNSMDTLILNSIEIVGMPEVALAADEDFSDSLERLREYLDMMTEPV